ncbi:MAG: DUF4336 domain-containing protein [Polyangiaceae bacterium]|jgi:hypothetical protein|nr:DUF4336 domain-containing protein [Polyangiaceae bacterium]
MQTSLTRVAEGLWTLTRPQTFLGVETGTRMNLVQLTGGGLLVHSPVALDEGLRREVEALGPVQAVIAPSLFHHLYVKSWLDAFPGATCWASPGLEVKRPDLRWTGVLGDRSEALWAADVEQAPLTARFEREVVFFHTRSRTMLCVDAMIHLSSHPSRGTRAVAWLMGNDGPGKGYVERLAVRDRPLGRRQIDRILGWDLDRILLAHGAPIEKNGQDVLRDAYRWLR